MWKPKEKVTVDEKVSIEINGKPQQKVIEVPEVAAVLILTSNQFEIFAQQVTIETPQKHPSAAENEKSREGEEGGSTPDQNQEVELPNGSVRSTSTPRTTPHVGLSYITQRGSLAGKANKNSRKKMNKAMRRQLDTEKFEGSISEVTGKGKQESTLLPGSPVCWTEVQIPEGTCKHSWVTRKIIQSLQENRNMVSVIGGRSLYEDDGW